MLMESKSENNILINAIDKLVLKNNILDYPVNIKFKNYENDDGDDDEYNHDYELDTSDLYYILNLNNMKVYKPNDWIYYEQKFTDNHRIFIKDGKLSIKNIINGETSTLKSIDKVKNVAFRTDIPEWNAEGTTYPKELVLITHNLKELQAVMSNYVGIVRSEKRLKGALERLKIIYQETEELYQTTILSPNLCELRNLINIGYLIVKNARQRKESIGLHYLVK